LRRTSDKLSDNNATLSPEHIADRPIRKLAIKITVIVFI